MRTISKAVYAQGYLKNPEFREGVLYSHAPCPQCLTFVGVNEDYLFCDLCKALHKTRWDGQWYVTIDSEDFEIAYP